MADDFSATLLDLTTEIVTAHVSRNAVPAEQLPRLIQQVHGALAGLGVAAPDPGPDRKPAVPLRSSVRPDHLVCLEDGKKVKMLKRHLFANHGMTPAEYRARWNLAPNYPMVAPQYSAKRAELAKTIGLGRKAGRGNREAGAEQVLPFAGTPGHPEAAAAPKTRRTPAKKAAAEAPVA
jgi:predicted transcriptional regulator